MLRSRLQAAAGMVQPAALRSSPPQDGQLIKFSYNSTSPQLAAMVANGVADSFINTALQRRYEASAYARNFLERQIDKTRGDLERSERAAGRLCPEARGSSTRRAAADGKPTGGDTGSLQGKSLIALNRALADATARRVAAEGAYRQRAGTGPTSDVTASTQALRQQRATLEAEYQQKRTFMKPDHPGDAQPAGADRRARPADRARSGADVVGPQQHACSRIIAAALSAEQALQARVARLEGRRPQPARPKHPVQHPAARGGHQPQPL